MKSDVHSPPDSRGFGQGFAVGIRPFQFVEALVRTNRENENRDDQGKAGIENSHEPSV